MRTFYVFLLIALFPCSAIHAEKQSDYFPMQVGNTWTYERNILTWVEEQWVYVPEYVSVTITHAEDVDGSSYYIFSDGRIYRKSLDGQVLEYQNREEFLIFDFSPLEEPYYSLEYELSRPYEGVGMMIGVEGGGIITRKITHDPVRVPAGEFSGYVFYYSSVNEQDLTIYLAPSVGIVSYHAHDVLWRSDVVVYSLVNAMVDGKEYGVVSVKPSSWGRIKSLFR